MRGLQSPQARRGLAGVWSPAERGTGDRRSWVPVRTEGTVNSVGSLSAVSPRPHALCHGSRAVSHANGENVVSGKCPLRNNIRPCSRSACDILHFSSLGVSPGRLIMCYSLWDVRSLLMGVREMVGRQAGSPRKSPGSSNTQGPLCLNVSEGTIVFSFLFIM